MNVGYGLVTAECDVLMNVMGWVAMDSFPVGQEIFLFSTVSGLVLGLEPPI
jgi:hypothetical protein